MNIFTLYRIALLALISCAAVAGDGADSKKSSEYVTRLARESDIPALVHFVNTQAYRDSDKIVVVPERFREQYMRSAVQSNRLFVATHADDIVAFKKLFCITDADERDAILQNELRCAGANPPVAVGSLSLDDCKSQAVAADDSVKPCTSRVTYVYNGADFTHPDHRGKGVNAHLTKHALVASIKSAADHVQRHRSTHIALAYGITQDNAGNQQDLLGGRSKNIVSQFIPFVRAVAQECKRTPQTHLLLTRHQAFKPSFDPKAVACRPLSDDQAIPGYGCLLVSGLQPKEGDASSSKEAAS